MTDIRIERWANVLVNYSLGVKKGDLLQIKSTELANPLIQAVYRLALQKGANPYVTYFGEGLTEIFFEEASKEQLEYLTPIEKYEIEKIDHYLYIIAEYNRKGLSNFDPKKLSLRRKATGKLLERRLDRAAEGELHWSLTAYPDNAQAQDAEMSLNDFTEFIYSAGYLNDNDPIKKWQQVAKEQQRLIKDLCKFKKISIKTKGTDLNLSVQGRNGLAAKVMKTSRTVKSLPRLWKIRLKVSLLMVFHVFIRDAK